ncbi:HlyD family type I secretion periplasmic adaptor subunit [Nitrospirillum sp. BR 11752]|uniref:HlyD family type I secretion periplasmic adaptor subunit n=1 Tax=Nitrospirillum sp. BR 11752 TaxID=3104293 RepID=UPI002EC5EE1C|nr:HlyD family type I secretion periplasmic adaptor subunit [Nitrospirillum sp. BR 11752]
MAWVDGIRVLKAGRGGAMPRRRGDEVAFLPAALEIMETPASPVGRAIGGTIIAFFTLGLGWSWLGHIDIIATASGRIVPAGRVKVVQPLESGIVTAINVQDGDHVTAGQALIQLDTTTTTADRDRVAADLAQARLDVARLTALRAGIAGQPVAAAFIPPADAAPILVERARAATLAQEAAQRAKVAALDQQIAQKKAEAEEVAVTTAKLIASIQLLEQQVEMRRKLMEMEYGNKLSFLETQQKLVESQHELTAQKQRVEEASAARLALEGQRAQAVSDYSHQVLEDLAAASQKVAEHSQDLIKADQRLGQQTLTAPVSGTVQQLAAHTVGGVVTPAQSLLVVVPDDVPLVVEANIDNKDIGFVHRGQEVEMKIETFTFTRYGLVRGRVLDVSRDAVTPERDTAGGSTAQRTGGDPAAGAEDHPPSATPTYLAHIALDRTTLMVDGREEALTTGMAVTAEIKTGRRRVIDYLLSPLGEYVHDGLKER